MYFYTIYLSKSIKKHYRLKCPVIINDCNYQIVQQFQSIVIGNVISCPVAQNLKKT